MTIKRKRPGRNNTWLQATLGLGSVVATMVGTGLVAGVDNFSLTETAVPDTQPLPQTTIELPPIPTVITLGERQPLIMPSQSGQQFQSSNLTIEALPTVVVPNVTAQDLGSVNVQGESLNINLAPIPEVVVPQIQIPQPVTTSKSSK